MGGNCFQSFKQLIISCKEYEKQTFKKIVSDYLIQCRKHVVLYGTIGTQSYRSCDGYEK